MVNVEFSEGISETLDILNHMEKLYLDKLPKKLKDFLEENKSDTYVPHLDHSQKISQMPLKEKTKDILAAIYMNYWCAPEKKSEYMNLLNANESKYQAELREKYNPDNIFKNKRQEAKVEEKSVVEEVSMVEYKESIFRKFINSIKRFFNIS